MIITDGKLYAYGKIQVYFQSYIRWSEIVKTKDGSNLLQELGMHLLLWLGLEKATVVSQWECIDWNKKRKCWVMLTMYIRSTKYINWFIRSTAKNIFINWHLILWLNKSHLIQTTRRLSTFFHNSYQISLWLQWSNLIFIAKSKKWFTRYLYS